MVEEAFLFGSRMKKTFRIEVPEGADRVLLHACCAPCSAAIVEWLLQHDVEPVLYYCNPNIYPLEEYLKRKDECTRFAALHGLEVVEADYDHAAWLATVRGLEHEPERGNRCACCFRLRLASAARYAHDHGMRVVATTLASSRWKNLDQVNAVGREAAAHFPDVTFWAQNWRKGGLQERRNELLRRYAFYNQPYCGCEFSFRPSASSETQTSTGQKGSEEPASNG